MNQKTQKPKNQKPTSTPDDKRLQLRLHPTEKQIWANEAKKRNLNISSLIKLAVFNYLRESNNAQTR